MCKNPVAIIFKMHPRAVPAPLGFDLCHSRVKCACDKNMRYTPPNSSLKKEQAESITTQMRGKEDGVKSQHRPVLLQLVVPAFGHAWEIKTCWQLPQAIDVHIACMSRLPKS